MALAPSPDYLRNRLRYDEDLQELVWLRREVRPDMQRTDKAWNTKRAGKIAGTSSSKPGYRQLRIDKAVWPYSRILWAVAKNEWVNELQIDHIDRNPRNNQLSNLRKATQTQNNANTKIRADNVSGFKGVQLIPSSGKWRARVRDKDGQRHLGCFDTPLEASKAYEHEARKLFGEFASIGG